MKRFLKVGLAANASLRCSKKVKLGIEREKIVPEVVSGRRDNASATTLVLPVYVELNSHTP